MQNEPPIEPAYRVDTPVAAGTRTLLFCALSFLAGAVFWNTIGIWRFVETVVLVGPKTVVKAERGTQTPVSGSIAIETSQITTGSINHTRTAAPKKTSQSQTIAADNCSGYARDPDNGVVTPTECPSTWTPPVETKSAGREDLALGEPPTESSANKKAVQKRLAPEPPTQKLAKAPAAKNDAALSGFEGFETKVIEVLPEEIIADF